jgi:hypothetical protein
MDTTSDIDVPAVKIVIAFEEASRVSKYSHPISPGIGLIEWLHVDMHPLPGSLLVNPAPRYEEVALPCQ